MSKHDERMLTITWDDVPSEKQKELFIFGLKEAISQMERGPIRCGTLLWTEIDSAGVEIKYFGWWHTNDYNF